MSMNQKTLIPLAIITVALGAILYFFCLSPRDTPVVAGDPDSSSSLIIYKNTKYGFNFSLPTDWQGYSIIEDTWKGFPLKNTAVQTGPKLLIRNPKWTAAMPYEDLPILVFTISQWNMYLAEDFSVSAAPIRASELARNNKYVFALPPRWDFDSSAGYKDAQDIIVGKPLQAFDVGVSQGKLNIDLVCEKATSYMRFADAKSLEVFLVDCKEGKHPEVIEKYKADMNLGDGATI